MRLANILLRVRGAGALTDPEVASELRLSDTQVVRIKDVQKRNAASLRDRLRELFRQKDRPRSTLRDSLRELQAEAEKNALGQLSADQMAKLSRLQGTHEPEPPAPERSSPPAAP
jgi:hypothetical protein